MSLSKTFIQRNINCLQTNRESISLLTRVSSSTYAFWVSTLMYCCLPQRATALSRSPKPCAFNGTDEVFILFITFGLSPYIPFHFINFKTPSSIKGEYKVKYECFMTLRDEDFILVRTFLLLHVHKINCIAIVSIEQRWAAILYSCYYRKVTLFQTYQISFTLIPYFKKVIVCSPMTNSD